MHQGRFLDPAETLDGALGFEILALEPDQARARFRVENRVRQPFGIVHGGAYAALAESVCSASTYFAVRDEGKYAVGLSNSTSFLRPVSGGTVHAQARVRHRGRTTWVWDVDLTDDDGRLCAVSRVTMAVRPVPRDDEQRSASGGQRLTGSGS
ncbi:PaaI family thioesterase [Thermoleophilum album]|uniref:PaaI family thioesterase n=1 Tax=Thermoleophilum album TaxID=29539 RepID=UPI00237C8B00|nr:PaaI family thioesterase [Thermoleophilum album]WDT92762.1 PaaI family thioesterase [Thermoleophilum album]